MKNKLTILLIVLASIGYTGCNTHTDTTTYTLPQHSTDIDIHKDYDQFYYKGEGDTTLTYEELQKQYDHYISLVWKAKLEGRAS